MAVLLRPLHQPRLAKRALAQPVARGIHLIPQGFGAPCVPEPPPPELGPADPLEAADEWSILEGVGPSQFKRLDGGALVAKAPGSGDVMVTEGALNEVNVEVNATCQYVAAGSASTTHMLMCVRVQGNGDYVGLRMGGGNLEVWKRVSGTLTQLDTLAPPAVPFSVKLGIEGSIAYIALGGGAAARKAPPGFDTLQRLMTEKDTKVRTYVVGFDALYPNVGIVGSGRVGMQTRAAWPNGEQTIWTDWVSSKGVDAPADVTPIEDAAEFSLISGSGAGPTNSWRVDGEYGYQNQAGDYAVALKDYSFADGWFEYAAMNAPASNSNGAFPLCMRIVDHQNYLGVRCTANEVQVYEVTGGSFKKLGGYAYPSAIPFKVRLRCDGPNVYLTRGTEPEQTVAGGTALLSAGRVGMVLRSSNNNATHARSYLSSVGG